MFIISLRVLFSNLAHLASLKKIWFSAKTESNRRFATLFRWHKLQLKLILTSKKIFSHTFLILAFKPICDNLDRKQTQIHTTIGYNGKEWNVRVFFTESLCKERSSGKPMKCDFSFIKNTQNILFACLCEFIKDCCLVYFCTNYYEISQFVSSIYHSNDTFEVCFIASLASFLRFAHGFVDSL